jgi:cell division protein FtsQ
MDKIESTKVIEIVDPASTADAASFTTSTKAFSIKGSITNFINNDSLKSIKKMDDVFRISNYVCNHPLMYKLIGQVYLEKDGDFVLIPLVGDQKIVFGTANTEEEVAEKFSRLTTFYKEAIPFEGWDKYVEISVKYDGQIVCRRRN